MAQETKEAFFARLSETGIARVKANFKTKVYLQGNEPAWVIEWLERETEAFNSAQASAATRAADAAEVAAREAARANTIATTSNRIARLALVIAAISIALSLIGIFHKP